MAEEPVKGRRMLSDEEIELFRQRKESSYASYHGWLETKPDVKEHREKRQVRIAERKEKEEAEKKEEPPPEEEEEEKKEEPPPEEVE